MIDDYHMCIVSAGTVTCRYFQRKQTAAKRKERKGALRFFRLHSVLEFPSMNFGFLYPSVYGHLQSVFVSAWAL